MVHMYRKDLKLNQSKKISFVEVQNLFEWDTVQAIISRIFGLENLIVQHEQIYPSPKNSIIFKDKNRELGVPRVWGPEII